MPVTQQTHRELHREGAILVTQDDEGHLHVYYNGVYRLVVALAFWNQAHLSVREEEDFMALVMAGTTDIIRIPLIADITMPVEEEMFPEFIGGPEDTEAPVKKVNIT